MDAAGKSQTFYEDTTAFGTMLSTSGSGTTPFKFGGGNGCQTDADTVLVLMGHRYYDARTGRFLTQDPAGDGDNWYAYADNSPTNEIDPEGLVAQSLNGGYDWMSWGQMQSEMGGWDPGTYDIYKYDGINPGGTYWQTISIDSAALNAAFTSTNGPLWVRVRQVWVGEARLQHMGLIETQFLKIVVMLRKGLAINGESILIQEPEIKATKISVSAAIRRTHHQSGNWRVELNRKHKSRTRSSAGANQDRKGYPNIGRGLW